MPLIASPFLVALILPLPLDAMKGPAEIAHGPMFLGYANSPYAPAVVALIRSLPPRLTMNILLYGIMITQIYLYMTTYKRDPLYIKLYVAVLMLADTLNTGFMVAYLYKSLVVHFNDLAYLAKANWGRWSLLLYVCYRPSDDGEFLLLNPSRRKLIWFQTIQGIIGSMVQLFYAWRIHTLTGNIWIVGLICICALTNAFGGLASASAIAFVPQFSHFQEFQIPVICWLMSAAVGDVIITATLVSFFRKHRTGCSATDTRVDQIIRLTIQTGMITSVCSVIDLGLFLGDSSGMHLLFNLPLAKLYSNSLMSSLNARGGWRRSEPADSGEMKTLPLHLSVNVPSTSTAGTYDRPSMVQQAGCHVTSAASQKSCIDSHV
ncbi:WD-REPEATS-REGION domain-containing protein [Mycena venus]|uniref:WD-REPEATS-REGION domain-containing protein n=1 Tax=Mycena venus TaxID=2733690 RepID=A0A8H6Z0A0_9AGAR|nr:WD-REPEATS-REGION domain-containing protein [Mycena venus]